MASNFIYQIRQAPVDPEEYIIEDDYFDVGFIGSIADYVDGDVDRNDLINVLRERLEGIAAIDDSGKFTIINKIKYFEDKYKNWKKNLKVLLDTSLEEFANYGDTDTTERTLRMEYNDRYGDYVDYDGGLFTMDQFMRRLTENGDTWYIGGVIRYHT